MSSVNTAFLGASTIFGKHWLRHRKFDYLIDRDNFKLTFGKSFRTMVFLDHAVANGPAAVRDRAEEDAKTTDYLVHRLGDIKPELTIFVTTCDMLPPDADENAAPITHSDDPYVQNRITMYQAVNHQYGRVLNVHLPEIASLKPEFNPLLSTILNPGAVKKTLPFAPLEYHQLYLPQRIWLDVEKCIPLGIPAIIPAMPALTTTEIVELLAPELVKKLRAPKPEDPMGSRRSSIHAFQWPDFEGNCLQSKDDLKTMLKFFFRPDLAV